MHGVLLLFVAATALAQNTKTSSATADYRVPGQLKTYRLQIANTSGKTVEVAMDRNARFSIKGYEGNEIVITANSYEPPPARAKGLKPLYSGGSDNTGIGLSVNEDGNTVSITRATRQDGSYEIRVPDKVSLKVDEVNWGGDEMNISDMAGEVEIQSKTSNVHLINVTGPVTASSTSGNITVVFSKLNQTQPTSISDISGDIDITLPKDTKANFDMKSISGEIYTDFNMDMKNKRTTGMNYIGGGSVIESTINGGGVDVNMRNISGNIYVRKK